MRVIISVITLTILLYTISPCLGEVPEIPYQPSQTITVVTESLVTGPMSSGGVDGIFWQVAPEACDDGSFCLGFSRSDTGHLVCRLSLTGIKLGLYLADGAEFPYTLSGNDLMIFYGFSVPCDILPVNAVCAKNDPDIIEIRRNVGGRVFAEHFQVDCTPVTNEDALAQGWLREFAGNVERLVLVKVINLGKDETVAMQLWKPGDAWWIYEETPFRRSWRLR